MKLLFNLKNDKVAAFWGILISLIVFYPNLFLVQSAHLMADHWEQHFPWAYYLWTSLRVGHFPLWTDLIQTGFPITAESQIGSFYLPNLLLYATLPFRIAYSYNSLLHFFISGWATYLYARQLKIEPFAAFVAAFIYLFGSTYGGAYYNVTSLKTLAWFPLYLLLFEKYCGVQKIKYLLGIGFVLSLSFLAGYLQVAAFAGIFFGLYVLLRLWLFPEAEWRHSFFQKLKILLGLSVAGALALAIAFPQLYLTYQMSILSGRFGVTEDYAYVGSMSPLATLTLVMPNWQMIFRGNSIYGGIFALILFLVALTAPAVRKKASLKLWLVLILIALLLALGRWSPLFVAFIKLTKFYSFRTAVKFLIFICFGISILAGLGFSQAWASSKTRKKDTSYRLVGNLFLGILVVTGGASAFIYFFVNQGRDIAIRVGEWFIGQFIHGHAGHPHSMEIYRAKLQSYLSGVGSLFEFDSSWNLFALIMIAIGVIFALVLRHQQRATRTWVMTGLIFLVCDLFIFSWFDIQKDFDSYAKVDQKLSTPLFQYLQNEKAGGELGRIYGFRHLKEELSIVPSANFFIETEDIGAYSPLVSSRYHESIGQLGNVNDSTLAYSPPVEYVLGRLSLIKFLGVSHILTKHTLNHPELQIEFKDDLSGERVYQLSSKPARGYWISRVEVLESWDALNAKLLMENFDPRLVLLLEKNEARKVDLSPTKQADVQYEQISPGNWNIQTNQPGFFVIPRLYYPGWKAYLNNSEVPILAGHGLFQTVWIPKAGTYKLAFDYRIGGSE